MAMLFASFFYRYFWAMFFYSQVSYLLNAVRGYLYLFPSPPVPESSFNLKYLKWIYPVVSLEIQDFFCRRILMLVHVNL